MDNILNNINEKYILDPKHNYAVFDFDNTCIINDIGEATINFLCENKLLKDQDLLDTKYPNSSKYHQAVLHYYYKLLDTKKMEQAYSFGAQCLSGFSIHEIEKLIKKIISTEGTEIQTKNLFNISVNKGLQIQKTVSSILDYSSQNNIDIYIISASPEYIVNIAFPLFYPNIKATVIGVKNKCEDSILSKNLLYPLSMSEGKVTNIQNKIHLTKRPLLAVGDSMNDFPMLKYSLIPIVVYRNNDLSKYAKQNNWDIITK